MSELTPLREAVDTLAARAPSPDFGELERRATRRGRRRIAMVAAASAIAVVTALGAALAVDGQRDGVAPVEPHPTPSTDAAWPLERIRDEGTVEAEYVAPSGVSVRLYGRCDESLRGPSVPDRIRSVCGSEVDPPIRQESSRFALEVSQGGRSALFTVYGQGGLVVAAYGDDAVIYSDHEFPSQSLSTDRYRLLRADGSEAELDLQMDSPVPAVPGPGVVVLRYGEMSRPDSHPFLFDENAGTLRPLETSRSAEERARVERELGVWVPESGLSWGPNADESLWFVYHDCTVHWGSGKFWGDGGTFEEHQLACAAGFDGSWGGDETYLTEDMFPEGWLRPGRMALIEDTAGHLFVHVTLDQGKSWQRIPVSDEAAVPDTLRQLG